MLVLLAAMAAPPEAVFELQACEGGSDKHGQKESTSHCTNSVFDGYKPGTGPPVRDFYIDSGAACYVPHSDLVDQAACEGATHMH
jgi:hypothetical protein